MSESLLGVESAVVLLMLASVAAVQSRAVRGAQRTTIQELCERRGRPERYGEIIAGSETIAFIAASVVAIAAVQLGFMRGGSIVIEQVFALHGVGFLAWESIAKNDFPVVQAVVLVLAVIYVALTMVSDLMNAVLDPRLRA